MRRFVEGIDREQATSDVGFAIFSSLVSENVAKKRWSLRGRFSQPGSASSSVGTARIRARALSVPPSSSYSSGTGLLHPDDYRTKDGSRMS
jgi:hypothetical protein